MTRSLLLLAVLVVPGVAAPVPKALKRPPALTITLAADDRDHRSGDGIRVTVTNHTTADLRWTYTTIPLAAFEVRAADESGREVEIAHPRTTHSPFSRGMPCRVASGDSLNMRFGLSQCFPTGGRPGGPLRLTVAFTHGGRTYLSEPLEVK